MTVPYDVMVTSRLMGLEAAEAYANNMLAAINILKKEAKDAAANELNDILEVLCDQSTLDVVRSSDLELFGRWLFEQGFRVRDGVLVKG